MDEPENRDDKIIAFKHPLRSYKTYLKAYKSDFAKIREKCGGDQELFQSRRNQLV
jgi:hypothetical protein